MKNTKLYIFIALIVILLSAVQVYSNLNKEQKSQKVGSKKIDTIEFSGKNYFPDSVAVSRDKTLYVGSMWTGQIDKVPSGSSKPVSFVPAEADGRTVLGLHVDENANKLWAVFWDFKGPMKIPALLKSFELETGELIKTYEYPAGSIGNDLTMDGQGNIYTTCSFTHRIYRLPADGDAFEVWSEDPAFSENWKEGNWTLNGIDWNGGNIMYVTRTDIDGLFQVTIEEDGSAGVVSRIAVDETKSNMGYDGIEALDSDTILIAEYGTNRLTMVDVSGGNGTKRVVNDKLDFPTNLAIIDNGAWVVESQINHLLYPDQAGPASEPFRLKFVSL